MPSDSPPSEATPIGKRQIGACGHMHEFVLPAFSVCLTRGCSGLPGDKCRRCGGDMQPFASPNVPDGTQACVACGGLWWSY